MTECNHCWHDRGYTLTSNPPQVPEFCCYCNTSRVTVQTQQSQAGHGPYVQKHELLLNRNQTIWEHVTAKVLYNAKDNETTVAPDVPVSESQADGYAADPRYPDIINCNANN